jgi:hypothetical protein
VNCGLPAHSPIAHASGALVFEPVVDRDIPSKVERDAGQVESNPSGIGCASGRDQDIAAFNGLIARRVDL